MNEDFFSFRRIGLIGGGQLGKMTAQVAKRMGFTVQILDPSPLAPATPVSDLHVVGSLYDEGKLRELASLSDVLTYDIEHIDTHTLITLEREGHLILPSPFLLEIIQDKFQQKQILAQHGVPVPRFEQVEKLDEAYLKTVSLPIVQKARKGGYDGKGVVILRTLEDEKQLLSVPSFLEEWIECSKELAVIVARTPTGDIACYPVAEMVFDDRTNICDIVAVPAQIDEITTQKAQQVALHAVEALNGVGIFGVEMFLTPQGDILVNEIAPRPHNSGHYTIEACVTCQFEQLVRIVGGLPLGEVSLLRPAVMWNLLGEAEYTGTPVVEGLKEALSIPGVSFHFYGKTTTYPFRKMGHITILADNLSQAFNKLNMVKTILKVKGSEKL